MTPNTDNSKLLATKKGTKAGNTQLTSTATIENNLIVNGSALISGNLDTEKIIHSQSIHLREKERKPLISFVFDDSYTGQAPILDSKGVQGTIAFVTTWNMDLDEMHTLENNGWEIASHSVDHVNPSSSESEYKDSRDYLRGQGFDVVGYVTPFGGATAEMDKWARKYYTWTRDIVCYGPGSAQWQYSELCNYPPITTYHLKGTETAGHDLAELKGIVDAAEENHYWITWMVHGGDVTDSDLSALIDYIQAKNIDILPVKNALEIYGNSIDEKGFRVDNEGNIDGKLGTLRTIYDKTLVVNGAIQQIGTGLGDWTVSDIGGVRSGNLGTECTGYLAIPLGQGAHLTKLEQYFWTDDPNATITVIIIEADVKTIHYPQSIGSMNRTGDGWIDINLDYIIEENHFVEIYYEINRGQGSYAFIISPIVSWHYE